jgi:hypothetical protein
MAVFTTIASAIVGAISGIGFTAALAAAGTFTLTGMAIGVIAAGLAFGTAKLMGVFDVPDMGPDPGTKIQVAPSTDNRIGVAYGRNFMSGPITDVAITNQNDTMQYCITLSEYVEGETYTVNQIFWGDRKLNFPGGYPNATSANVISYSDPNATTTEDWANKIRIRVYAGSTNSVDQIFPASPKTNATNHMKHWTTFGPTHYTMEGLVFAMIELDYDAENGLAGLGSMTFDLTNSMHNPGEVLFDYMTNTRYGAGLANADIDITSILGTANTQMKGYCDEQITYTPNTGGSSTIDRYQINGYLSTYSTCMDNIDDICRNAGTYFTFDGKQGKFKAIPNRPYSTSELSNAFQLNDDNLIGKISITSTELYNTLNKVTVSFADQNRKDQTNTVVVETPSGDRNTGEPDNNLEYRLPLVNNNIHAQQLGNLDLNQSRKGMVVTTVGDFSCLEIDAGDVVKLSNSDYGFTDKLFRVMKNKELLGQDGMISCELLLLEYDATVYTEPTVTESEEEDDPIDVPVLPPPPPIDPPNKYQLLYQNVPIKSTSGSGTSANCMVLKALPNVYTHVVVLNSTADFAALDTCVISGGNLGGIDVIHDCTFTVPSVTGGVINNPITTISGEANVYNPDKHGSNIPTAALANASVGTQVEDQPASNLAMANTDVVENIHTPREVDFKEPTDGVEEGDYSFIATGTPVGSIPASGTANYSLRAKIVIEDIEGNTTSTEFGTSYNNAAEIPGVMNAVQKISIPADVSRANVVIRGKNTLAPNSGGQIGYTNLKYDLVKINKGDTF